MKPSKTSKELVEKLITAVKVEAMEGEIGSSPVQYAYAKSELAKATTLVLNRFARLERELKKLRRFIRPSPNRADDRRG